ncbi:MAG: hypothetical protein Q8O91_09000 [Candidatus Aminicenantes bacterium]|nr:hypothetical protein [Candidatus Aminicenantes bacterium]
MNDSFSVLSVPILLERNNRGYSRAFSRVLQNGNEAGKDGGGAVFDPAGIIDLDLLQFGKRR